MTFLHETNRIYGNDDAGNLIAEITFPEVEAGVFCIDHTYVSDSLRGQGIAGQLMERAIESIRARGGRVTATCSYAIHYLEKHPRGKEA